MRLESIILEILRRKHISVTQQNQNRSCEERFAVIIDADNAQASLISQILKEVSRYGKITIRRIYGDWTIPQLEPWKKLLPQHAIQPIQQFRNTVGKNATDSAMIIDAMDILFDGNIEGFAIVSSDSDYTRLAIRIREEGKFVLGLGKRHTPAPFVKACDQFVYTENLEKSLRSYSSSQRKKSTYAKDTSEKSSSKVEDPSFDDELSLLEQAFDMVEDEDGYTYLSEIGKALRKLDPAFDLRTYGYSQLSKMIKAHDNVFELLQDKKNGPSPVYVRKKEPGS